MKRITLSSLEYGLAFGVDRAIRRLVTEGLMSAVGCFALSDIWAREYLPLRDAVDAARGDVLVGVNLSLTAPWAGLSRRGRVALGERLPPPRWYGWRSFFHLLPDGALEAEMEAQIQTFEEFYQRPPDFLAVADHLHHLQGVAKALFKVAELQKERPIIFSPFIESHAPNPHARRFRRRAAKFNLEVYDRGPDLPNVRDEGEMRARVWRGFEGVSDLSVIECHPAEIDDRLRRVAAASFLPGRSMQLSYLLSDEFHLQLVEKNVFLF